MLVLGSFAHSEACAVAPSASAKSTQCQTRIMSCRPCHMLPDRLLLSYCAQVVMPVYV